QPAVPKKSPKRTPGQPVDNTKMVIKIDKEFYDIEAKDNTSIKNGCNNNDDNVESKNTVGEKCEVSIEKKIELKECKNLKDKVDDKNVENSRKDSRRGHSRNSSKPDKDHVLRYRPPKSQKTGATSRNESQVVKQNTQNKNVQNNFGLAKSKSEGNPFRHKGAKKCVERPKL
ncbi:hypothetical protein HHI36_021609, partial [Cryptolaemus montrouzieri]